jgi:hypothetical protein
MYPLEGGSIGLQIGGEAADLILLIMNDRGMESILSSKVKLGADASVAGPKVVTLLQTQTPGCELKFSVTRVPAVCLPAFLWKAPLYVPTMTPVNKSMDERLRPRIS